MTDEVLTMNESPPVLQSLIELGRSLEPVTVAVCHPCSDVSLCGAMEAAQAQLIEPVLVGPPAKLQAVADDADIDTSSYRLIATAHSHQSAARAVALCRSGECEALMKGSLHTDELMTKLPTLTGFAHGEAHQPCIHHGCIDLSADAPDYRCCHKHLSDARGQVAYRTERHRSRSYAGHPPAQGRYSVRGGNGRPKILSTIDAAALCKMADRGQITGAIWTGRWHSIPQSTRKPPGSRDWFGRGRVWQIFWWFRTWSPATCWPNNWNISPMPRRRELCWGHASPLF